MKLSDLLVFDEIVIQCHDNPDADALASGYALYWYLKRMGKNPRFIYRGYNKIRKSNLLIMKEQLNIPVSYEPDFNEKPELLVVVDCQYGQKNVTITEAETIAIIDHHQVAVDLPELSLVRSNMGSCSTVIWNMIKEEGLDSELDRELSTALYYGLYTDTNRFTEVSHPLDRDMMDALTINKSLIKEMSNSNISLEELKITGNAIVGSEYSEEYRYLIIQAAPCDPIILGVVSDFSMETENVDVCVAFYSSPNEVKFSVRSCTKEVHANEVAEYLAEGFGGGGGHLYKAGGVLWPDKLNLLDSEIDEIPKAFIRERLDGYFEKYEIIYAKTAEVDMEGMTLYEKQPQHMGAVKLSDIFESGTTVEIRTLEGDVSVQIDADMYLMIGIEGEVYPITKNKLMKSYTLTGEAYKGKLEYDPSIKDVKTGEKKNVLAYAVDVISRGGSKIYARPLNKYVKLFTAWDEEKYYSGKPGDYIAMREDDRHDLYIIRRRLMNKLYSPS
ncbi:MAG: DHH family phosphoesterase [Eubacterium sp.]|nr:DHH family phosphoesterase [Eubacterium sp.]